MEPWMEPYNVCDKLAAKSGEGIHRSREDGRWRVINESDEELKEEARQTGSNMAVRLADEIVSLRQELAAWKSACNCQLPSDVAAAGEEYRQELAVARAALREVCDKWKDGSVAYPIPAGELYRCPQLSKAWYERAKAAGGGA